MVVSGRQRVSLIGAKGQEEVKAGPHHTRICARIHISVCRGCTNCVGISMIDFSPETISDSGFLMITRMRSIAVHFFGCLDPCREEILLYSGLPHDVAAHSKSKIVS